MSVIHSAKLGSLPTVHLQHPDGSRAVLTLFGAHLVSWKTPDGAEQLFCSERSALDGSRPIRGGVPVIFPQFNERGPILRHGFARVSNWSVADSGEADGAAYVVLELAPSDLAPARAAEWPHPFSLRLRVAIGGEQLAMTLEVLNTGTAAFDFSAALHTYHQVHDVAAVRIDGVHGRAAGDWRSARRHLPPHRRARDPARWRSPARLDPAGFYGCGGVEPGPGGHGSHGRHGAP